MVARRVGTVCSCERGNKHLEKNQTTSFLKYVFKKKKHNLAGFFKF